jgi:exosome complex component RRP4
MEQKTREVVIPSQLLGSTQQHKAGYGTFVENGNIYAERLGILNKHVEYINVSPLKGRYSPIAGDFVIGIVEEALQSGWLIDINAPYPALLHVTETPWKVDFGDAEKYLNCSDAIMAKILSVDESKKLQVTMNDRNLFKIKTGNILDVEPSKVPRIIGKDGSMIDLIKKYTRCRIFVGQNGRIWIEGDDAGIARVTYIIDIIENESLSYGLTKKIEELLIKETKDVQ